MSTTWMTLKSLLIEALERPSDERSAFLKQACGDDEALQRRAATMLADEEKARSFFAGGVEHISFAESVDFTGCRIDRYQIIRRIAAGGMGTVYEAQQDHPRRRVAIKVMKSGLASEEAFQRFRHEANVLGRLTHPGIAQIYDAGVHRHTSGPAPYFVMEYVEHAQTVCHFAQTHGLPTEGRLALFLEICDAVQFGHRRGIIHRDLKPENLLIDADGKPKVIDFGIARTIDPDASLAFTGTMSGGFIGSLRYMSPEQCSGDADDLDIRTDVYSLGVTLFELLTGELPYDFRSSTLFEIPRVIREVDARRLSSIDRTFGGDLETIALKALEKDRDRRYQTVADLAADVRRLLNREPIEAKRDRGWYVLGKTLSRHRGLVAAATIGMLLIVSAASMFAILYRSASTQAEALRQTVYFNSIALAQNAYKDANTPLLRQLLQDCPPDLRNWEWHYLTSLVDTSEYTIAAHESVVTDVVASPDQRLIASASRDATIKIWDAARGSLRHTLEDHTREVTDLAFSPDGRRLASASFDGTARLWDVESGTIEVVLSGHTDAVSGIAFSPDGRHLVTASTDRSIRLWETESGRQERVLGVHDQPLSAICWTHDGRWILAGDWSGAIKVWSSDGASPIRTFEGHRGRIRAIALSPDGARFATVADDLEIRLWDFATGVCLQNSASDLILTDVAFTEDGQGVVVSGSAAIRVWPLHPTAVGQTRLGHDRNVSCLHRPEGSNVIWSGGSDGTIKRWRLDAARPGTLAGHTDMIRDLAVSPDGASVVTASRDESLREWDLSTRREIRRLQGHGRWVRAVAVSADSSLIASGGYDHDVRIWDRDTGKQLHTLSGHTAPVLGVAFAPDDSLVASCAENGVIRVWSTRSWTLLRELTGHTQLVYRVRFSPVDPSRLVSAGHDNTVRYWNVHTGDTIHAFQGDDDSGSFLGVDISPDGATLAAACSDSTIMVWDIQSGRLAQRLRGHWTVAQSVAFSPDGSRLASGGYDHIINLWDPATGRLLLVLRGHTGGVLGLDWSPDGSSLYSGSNDGTIKTW